MLAVTRLALIGAMYCSMGRAEESRPWQSYATRLIGIETGLPSNGAPVMCQTSDGYLWIGTEAGLARYDGVRLVAFRRSDTPGLPDNLIRCFYQDTSGTLWIGTNRGLSIYRQGRFESVPQFAKWAVAGVTGDATGRVWIGTQGDGLWEYSGGTFKKRVDGKLMADNQLLRRTFVDKAGRLWIGLLGGGMICFENGKFFLPAANAAEIPEISHIAEDARGSLWFATARGLYQWRDGVLQRRTPEGAFYGDPVTAVYPDSDGRLWVVARHPYVAPSTEDLSFVMVPVPVDFCRMIMRDREGSFWLGTAGAGVVRLRPSGFRKVAELASYTDVRSLTRAEDGSVWAGAAGRGLVRVAPTGATSLIDMGAGFDYDIWAIESDGAGGIWFGTTASLGRWKDGRMERFPSLREVHALFRDHVGTMWIGPAGGGVFCYRDGALVSMVGKIGGSIDVARAFAEDQSGALYVAFSATGLVRYEDGVATAFNVANGLPDDQLRFIYPDREGNLWVGSKRRGLMVLTGGRWYNPDSLSVPFNDLVNGISEDDAGNLWLGTGKGIIWVEKDNMLAVARGQQALLKYHVASAEEGAIVSGVGFGGQPEMARMPEGSLWFAMRAAVVEVQPKNVTRNTIAPAVAIEEVIVDGRRRESNGGLVLPAGVRSLIINYTALSFVQPERVAFRYRLEGHDRDWVEAGTRRTAFYSNLTPGTYRFNVIAANEDGVWNEAGATAAFMQLPWFYQTWWFYVGVACVLGGVVALLYLWRTADLRRLVRRQTEQIRLQVEQEARLRTELERTARLESLGVLAGGIAHDFNNLLTVIIANIGLATLDERVREAAGSTLRDAELGAKRAAELTQQLLTFARGGDPVREAVLLPDIVREAADFACHGSKVRCEIDFAADLPPADADRGQISRVVHNLVLNAAQAMPEGGVIRIVVTKAEVAACEVPTLAAGSYVQLSIADSGPGIAPENLARIFDPYFSTKPRNSGLGLATVHSIVKKHQGHVTVESRLGTGTTFHVWLPAAKELPKPAASAVSRLEHTSRPARVLFMDDEETIRRFAAELLKRLGHDATLVKDGAEAVREYQAASAVGRPYDVVILDLTVPGGMGGKEAMELLRRSDPGVRGIVSSGYSSDPVLANHRSYGFRAVVPKPYHTIG